MKIIEITSENFAQEVEQAQVPTVVDFWAPWCGYCRRIEPALEQIAQDFDGKAVVARLNIDDAPEFAQRFGVETIPTLILFKEGKSIHSFVGPDSKASIAQWLENNGISKQS